VEKPLEFKNFAVNNRKYYTADLKLAKNGYNTGHTHDFYEFIVVIKGEFREFNDEENILLTKRSVHFIHPDNKHYFVATNQYNTNILRNIAIQKEFFEDCMNELNQELTENIFQYFELDEINFQSYKYKTEQLLKLNHDEDANLYLVKNILSDLFIFSFLNKNNRHNIPEWLQRVYLEIQQDKNYIEGLSRLVGLSGKSQEHLTREFKRYYGITPSEHINSIRLQEAAYMLRTSQEKIIDIIYECGFQNVSYFNRLFKEKYGIKPREYRDSNKNIFYTSI